MPVVGRMEPVRETDTVLVERSVVGLAEGERVLVRDTVTDLVRVTVTLTDLVRVTDTDLQEEALLVAACRRLGRAGTRTGCCLAPTSSAHVSSSARRAAFTWGVKPTSSACLDTETDMLVEKVRADDAAAVTLGEAEWL